MCFSEAKMWYTLTWSTTLHISYGIMNKKMSFFSWLEGKLFSVKCRRRWLKFTVIMYYCEYTKSKIKKSSSFLTPLRTPDPFKSSSSLLYFNVVLKMNTKTQERDKSLTEKKRKKLCCYGSVYSELLKFGPYLYFKTNRDHINNSRCCKGRIELITGWSVWDQTR